ncbi:hypothetical protein LNP00_04380 [Fructobacillus sp. M158]|nr:hypothetical protein [Fructobacillus parabroussonetiae]MCK8617599.1 hypothetical protein [Fructobacillus parabroussonetiae]
MARYFYPGFDQQEELLSSYLSELFSIGCLSGKEGQLSIKKPLRFIE